MSRNPTALAAALLLALADGPATDEFGIGYYAAGTVPGADRAPLFC
jgi:hypothetical protein